MSMALVLGGALCYSGMAALCLSMDRHHRQVWHRTAPARQRWLHIVGWILLAIAIWPCVRAWGSSVGVVVWFGLLSAAALVLVFLLPYRPKASVWLMGIAVLGSLPSLLLSAA